MDININSIHIKKTAFLKQVYSTDLNIYLNRLIAIGFKGKENVLDAGCGYGQWSFALAELNKKVTGIDISKDRIETSNTIAQVNNAKNISFFKSTIEKFDSADESFDAIFSYSVLYLTNYEKSIQNLTRLLKTEGVLYLNFNSFGIIPYFIFRRGIIQKDKTSLKHGFIYLKHLFKDSALGMKALSVNKIICILEKQNMKIIEWGGDGTINFSNLDIHKFYPAKFWRLNNVVEIFAKKI